MPIGSLSSMPAPSQFGLPGQYDDLLRGEALKSASYLSSMDQFYANLDEAQRQFDETLAFKTETRGLELGFSREQLAETTREFDLSLGLEERTLEEKMREFDLGFGLEEERFGLEEELGRGGLELQKEELAAQKDYQTRALALQGRELSMKEGSTREQLNLEQQKLDLLQRKAESESALFDYRKSLDVAAADKSQQYLDLLRAEQQRRAGVTGTKKSGEVVVPEATLGDFSYGGTDMLKREPTPEDKYLYSEFDPWE